MAGCMNRYGGIVECHRINKVRWMDRDKKIYQIALINCRPGRILVDSITCNRHLRFIIRVKLTIETATPNCLMLMLHNLTSHQNQYVIKNSINHSPPTIRDNWSTQLSNNSEEKTKHRRPYCVFQLHICKSLIHTNVVCGKAQNDIIIIIWNQCILILCFYVHEELNATTKRVRSGKKLRTIRTEHTIGMIM